MDAAGSKTEPSSPTAKKKPRLRGTAYRLMEVRRLGIVA